MSDWIREAKYVEENFLAQLQELEEWQTYVVDDNDNKHRTKEALLGRNGFSEHLLCKRLKNALKAINPWLIDEQIEEVISTLKNIRHGSLLEANEMATMLLLEGTSVDVNHETGDKSPTVKFIDFDNVDNNDFYAVSQFLIEGAETIIPDITLFINGIPIVVIECKAPDVTDPIDEAVKQLKRYMDIRGTEQREGARQLFVTNAFTVATSRTMAKAGTISSNLEHYLSWKDPYPFSLEEAGADEQSILIHGMLNPANLLEIIQSFIIYKGTGRKRAKMVCRYQQYRAVKKTVKRVLEGKDQEERSGVVWHTQGSGKSLTMVFLIRHSRTIKAMESYKILFVVDRSDLEEQLEETAQLSGERITVAVSGKDLKKLLANDTSDISMTMMQKFNDDEEFKSLSDKSEIMVLIDEAHRTQYSKLGANLRKALPHAARIAFTGTPVEKTVTSFGAYIDTYKIEEAVRDGATVPIIYEGKTSEDALENDAEFDSKFEDLFADLTKDQQEQIKRKYGTKGDILSAPKRIKEIAKDMVEHYITNIMPSGFKAQVVSSSRKAALRYQDALAEALKEYYEIMDEMDPYKELVGRLSATAVISKQHNDNPDEYPPQFCTKEHRENSVNAFKKPLFLVNPREAGDSEEVLDSEKTSQLAFIVVSDMLLTGFDAPIEQVMYLDKKLVAHNLLQAIARVNRTHDGKSRGLIVDYFGVGNHLKEALSNYEDADVDGIMSDFSEEYAQLEFSHRKVMQFFAEHRVEEITEKIFEDAVVLLADEKLRQEFKVLYRDFSRLIDFILPNPIDRYYLDDVKVLGLVNQEANRRYRDAELSIEGIGAKVKGLIDEYLISKGVQTKVRPVSIFDDEFEAALSGRSEKSKASEMEHALRYTIKINLDKDPIHYKSLAEKLEKIIAEHQGNWTEMVKRFDELKKELDTGRDVLDVFKEHRCEVCMPFYDLFECYFGEDEWTQEVSDKVIELVLNSVQQAANEVQRVDYWGATGESARKKLENFLVAGIASSKLTQLLGNIAEIKIRFMEIAQANDKALKELQL